MIMSETPSKIIRRDLPCVLCVRYFPNKPALKIHIARSTEHYKKKLDLEDPDHRPLEEYF